MGVFFPKIFKFRTNIFYWIILALHNKTIQIWQKGGGSYHEYFFFQNSNEKKKVEKKNLVMLRFH